MNKAKENKGITLITVIIAVIIMTILVGVTTYSGINSYKRAKVTKFVAQMQLIQARVDELVSENGYSQLGTSAETYQNIITSANNNGEITSTSSEDFKFLSIDNLKDLDLENIDTDVLINFSTREVVSVKGVEYEGQTYYTQYKLPQGQTLITSNYTREGNIDFTINKKMDGLNCLITIKNVPSNCTLTYGEGTNAEDVEWNTISNYTKSTENYPINITKSSTYVFKLQDNTDDTDIEIQIEEVVTTNSPRTEMDFDLLYDYAKNLGDWYNINGKIWIPRFAYNKEDNSNIKFIKGNSNIATDNTYIDSQNWTVPSIFSNDNETGFWMERSELIEKMSQVHEQIKDMDTDRQKVGYTIANTTIEVINEEEIQKIETEVFGLEGTTVYDGKSYNKTNIALFSEKNIEQDFIIELNINNVDTENIVGAPTLLGAMDEDSSNNLKPDEKKLYPGFNIKVDSTLNGLKIETNSYRGKVEVPIPNGTENVQILRIDQKLYYSFDNKIFVYINDFSDYEGYHITPFDAPVVFGAGLDENGKPRRYFKGIIEDVSIRFIDNKADATVEDYNDGKEPIEEPTPEFTIAYIHNDAIEFIPDANGNPSQMVDYETREILPENDYQKDGMIYTGLYMFADAASLDKEFEISFRIKSMAQNKQEGQAEQAAIVNCKYEKTKAGNYTVSWPGFVYRLKKDFSGVELTAYGHTSGSGTSSKISAFNQEHKITISRKERKLYFSMDDATPTMVYDFTNYNPNNYFNVPITIGGSLNNQGVINQPFRGFKGVLSDIVVKVEQ